MSELNNGGPAFPRTTWTGSDKNAAHRDVSGMTLRDWFAGHSPYNADHAIEIINGKKSSSAPIDEVSKTLAKLNYAYADAMLSERSKP